MQKIIWLSFQWDMIEGRIRLTKMKDTIACLLRQTERFSDQLVRARC